MEVKDIFAALEEIEKYLPETDPGREVQAQIATLKGWGLKYYKYAQPGELSPGYAKTCERIFRFCLKDLGIMGSFRFIQKANREDFDFSKKDPITGEYNTKTGEMIILSGPLSDTLKSLAHETYHMYQHQKFGKEHVAKNLVQMEKEAYGYEARLLPRIRRLYMKREETKKAIAYAGW